MVLRMLLPPESYGLPDSAGNVVPLEFLHNPLYSSLILASGASPPRSLSFFSYSRGQAIPSTTTIATQFHTNMDAVGALPAPRTFTCYGVRFLVLPLDYNGNAPALADATSGAATADINEVTDANTLFNQTIFELRQGTAQECVGPSFLYPANTGGGGLAGVSVNANEIGRAHV